MSTPEADMAESTAATSVTSQGPIAKLPKELLSQIISYAPWRSVVTLRLVCRGFRDCAWPTFGEQFKRTKFDIRSIRSMKNLKAISENAELAPHVKNFQFATGFLDDEFPGRQMVLGMLEDFDLDDDDDDDEMMLDPEEYLDDDLLSRLYCFRNHIGYWFADAWKWTPCMAHHAAGTLEEYATSTQKQGIVDFLAKTFSKFPTIHTVEYKEENFPEAFRDIHKDIMDSVLEGNLEFEWYPTEDQVAIDILGVDILLQALAKGDIPVRNISIPVPAMYCHTLATHTSPDVLRRVFMTVETLRVEQSNGGPYGHHLGPSQELILTAANAPKLQHLQWRRWHPNPGTSPTWLRHIPGWMTLTPPVGDYPPLRYLELPVGFTDFEAGISFDETFFVFLSRVGETLKILSLALSYGMNWIELVQFLATSPNMSLEQLKVHVTTSGRSGLDTFFKNREVPPKDLVKQAAQNTTFTPSQFKTWMHKKWAPKRQGLRPKAKPRRSTRNRAN